MKVSRIPITLAALAFAAVSCMTADPFPGVDSPDTGDSDKLVGYVTDTDDNSIEHIKVTLDWNNGTYQEIKYTDSYGQFQTDCWQPAAREAVTLAITIEDVDGEENGGLFEPVSETIILFENGVQDIVDPMVFRLNRATASESSPQI
jgi:hypothetical protein